MSAVTAAGLNPSQSGLGGNSKPQAELGHDRLAPPLFSSIDVAMLASIGRTAFQGSKQISGFEKSVLDEGDSRVLKAHGSNSRRLLIVGPDVIQFGDQPPVRVTKKRVAELMGIMIVERRLMNPAQYQELGFFREASTEYSRGIAFSKARKSLADTVVDGIGQAVTTRDGQATGIVDVLVKDLRHTTAYHAARYENSLGLFESYLLKGGKEPGWAELGSFRAARQALRNISSDTLLPEQRLRFKGLSMKTASMIASRTDTYNQEHVIPGHSRALELFVEEFEPTWQSRARCRAPGMMDLFFPPTDHSEIKGEKEVREEQAKIICGTCPVQKPCLMLALKMNDRQEGIWGGANLAERKQLLAQMRT